MAHSWYSETDHGLGIYNFHHVKDDDTGGPSLSQFGVSSGGVNANGFRMDTANTLNGLYIQAIGYL